MFFLSGLGIFFSIFLLFYNKGYKSANIYLGLFLILFNFIISSHYIYIFSNSREFIALVLSIPINATAYVIGPLAFFYVRSILTDNPKLTKYDVLHFILFAIMFLGRLPHNLASWSEKYQIADEIIFDTLKTFRYPRLNNILPNRLNYTLKVVHFFVYVIASWVLIFKNKFRIKSFGKGLHQLKIINNWLFFFAVILTFLGFSLLVLLFVFLSAEDKIDFHFTGNILFASIFCSFLISILGLVFFPQILYGLPLEKFKLYAIKNESAKLVSSEKEVFSFREGYIDTIRLLLENWKKENKFLDVDTSIYSMSKEIDIPTHHLTYFFSHINDEKYIEWRNRLRIEYAIELINNQKDYDKTIEVLGKESGFKSYPSFIQSFKQITGKLPKDYIKEVKN
jgi:AraC-like DNA-binding protein